MAFTAFLVLGTFVLLFLAWLQGKKHWVKATLNSLIAVWFGVSAGARIYQGEHPYYLPQFGTDLETAIKGLGPVEWSLVVVLAFGVVAILKWYQDLTRG